MSRKKTRVSILWITETAVMLALLVVLQAVTKGFGQFVTGSCVNAVLALSALLSGVTSALVVAVLSPVLAFLLGIAPQAVTVPAIMAGNAVFVVVMRLIAGRRSKPVWTQVLAWLAAAGAKFGVLYTLVVGIICGMAADGLLEAGLLKAPMLTKLPAMFAWPQLVTALIGGGVALMTISVLRKALNR